MTFEIDRHNLHFYYHEASVGLWGLGGHTSTAELHLLGLDALELRDTADVIARQFAKELSGRLIGDAEVA